MRIRNPQKPLRTIRRDQAFGGLISPPPPYVIPFHVWGLYSLKVSGKKEKKRLTSTKAAATATTRVQGDRDHDLNRFFLSVTSRNEGGISISLSGNIQLTVRIRILSDLAISHSRTLVCRFSHPNQTVPGEPSIPLFIRLRSSKPTTVPESCNNTYIAGGVQWDLGAITTASRSDPGRTCRI